MVSKSLQLSEGQAGEENHLTKHTKTKPSYTRKASHCSQLEVDLLGFVKLSERDKVLQEQLSNCDNPQKLEKVLKKYECEFTIEDIEKVSRELAASYWPWREKTRQERKAFFMKE